MIQLIKIDNDSDEFNIIGSRGLRDYLNGIIS